MKPRLPLWRTLLLAVGGAFLGMGLVGLVRALLLGAGVLVFVGAFAVGVALILLASPPRSRR